MPGPSLIQQQVDALRDLARLATERAKREFKLEQDFAKSQASAEKQYQATRQGIVRRRDLQIQAIEGEIEQARAAIEATAQAEQAAAKQERDQALAQAKKVFKFEKETADTTLEESGWQTTAVFDANMVKVRQKHDQLKRQLDESVKTYAEIKEAAGGFPARYKAFVSPDPTPPATEDEPGANPISKLDESTQAVHDAWVAATQLKILPILEPSFFIFLCLVLFVAVAGAVGYFAGLVVGLAVGAVAAGVLGFVARTAIKATARGQISQEVNALARAIALGDAREARAIAWVDDWNKKNSAEVERRRDADNKKARDLHSRLIPELEERRDRTIKNAEERYPKALAAARKKWEDDLEAAESKAAQELAEAKANGERELTNHDTAHYADVEARRVAYEEAWNTLIADWRNGVAKMKYELGEVDSEDRRLFPPWHDPAWDPWEPPAASPGILRLGEFHVEMNKIPDATPEDPRLKGIVPESVDLPAYLSFPDKVSLLLKASEEGRTPAVHALQLAMLRFITAIPPGKVRFTIIDPVGLGQNFSTFMHLAEYDELLINGKRIWTEQQQIDSRLVDMTEHMENVIQSYLRNEYESIEEYNEMAGEVAEPYRVIVVANYPANFSDIAQRRLVSIANSGPRCGVYTLISVDTKLAGATGPLAKDLEPNSVNLVWKDGRFVWKDSPFEQYPLQLDLPPDDDEFNRLVKLSGEAARKAKRVEVPFSAIAPDEDKYWTFDSRSMIDAPLGRAGATKFQNLKLGKGTSQHVLIAGKTGSGKSTLLHAMISNIALMYSPKEVELYLIDFKKGVEFKTYAAYGLPHARVVAVESEREFGLSVLQRLDVELKVRGDKYRVSGAQDVASYRRNTGEYLPRILLLVDEFQEFFIEDDKLAQEATLLLDRLVRQGRAFGIHVILGSQTLGGAYSLARTTIAQMAIRIALQCSEADSHLILSEDNAAARLLTRPGEAIYNDANGMIEGNHVFQVVWLPDVNREAYLKTLRQMAEDRGLMPDTPQLVFEGNLPADVSKNPLLNRALDEPTWPEEVRSVQVWLGDAIAIKDPTAALLRRQSGANILIIGQYDEMALGTLEMAVLSLATQHTPAINGHENSANAAKFYMLDGTPSDSPLYGSFNNLTDVIPHPYRIVGPREVEGVINEISEELSRRQNDDQVEAPSIYIMIYDLGRFRDLRKSDDDFGFSSSYGEESKPSASKQFATILREGPNFGIHCIAWCDTIGNLNRTFERQTAGEFELRVLFQMSINDSSALIDSPAAGKLGENRALYYNEEQGRMEKFRPYGLPSEEWLETVKQRIASKTDSAPGTEVGAGAA